MARRERQLRASLRLPQGLIERTHNEPLPKSRPTTRAESRRDVRKLAPDEVRRGTRRTQSGESVPIATKPRRGGGIAPTPSSRSGRP
jgi:hypothetical protein